MYVSVPPTDGVSVRNKKAQILELGLIVQGGQNVEVKTGMQILQSVDFIFVYNSKK